jgi:ATP-binding cassette subfamily F protein uup
VTSTLVFEGEGEVNEYVGGYIDWLRQRTTTTESAQAINSKTKSKSKPAQAPKPKPKAKLSAADEKELRLLPVKIEKLEKQIEKMHQQFAAPGFYDQSSVITQPLQQQLSELEASLKVLYERWEKLDQ